MKQLTANTALICFLKLALLLVLLPIFVPFAPKMPDSGIDPSWAMALNQAVAQHLSFGKDIIFTLGPYAAIYTKVYHPATDAMMLWGSLYLAFSYWMALLVLFQQSSWRWGGLFILFLITSIYVKDSLFFSYPLLIGLICYKHLFQSQKAPLSLGLYVLLFAPLGLLALIKCSFIMTCLLIIILCALFFIYQDKKQIALVCLLAPIISMLFFWCLAGQPIGDLIAFLLHSIYFVFVFTEAMAKEGSTSEIILYLVSSLFIMQLLVRQSQPVAARYFLVLVFGIFLFLSFKTGFIRHNHAIIAGTSLLLATLLLPFVVVHKYRMLVMILSISSGLYIISQYRALSLIDNFVSTYRSNWYGFSSRIKESDWLKRNFELIMGFQQAKAGIPELSGATDIYSYEQTYLIASGNRWSPRPVFQSYSTFAPFFAEKNKAYLEGERSPDHLVFKIEPIDERLPALEDGASWSVLLRAYQLQHQDHRFLYLQKREYSKDNLQPLAREAHQLGEQVLVPILNQPIFATLEIKPKAWGRLSILFFKISELEIICTMQDSQKVHYRLSANMAKGEFLLSPLVRNTDDFASLFHDESDWGAKRIKSFVIKTTENGQWQWQKEYTVQFKVLSG